jgi:threonine 3-dehydrogenase
MPSFKTALITGGNGNLGRLVANRLESIGVKVISFDLPGTESSETSRRSAVVLGDMRDENALRTLFETHRPQAVFHLASLLSGSSEADPVAAWEINATASVKLMRLAMEFGVGPFFFASTIATYGPGTADPLPEDAPQWPENVYGATKVAVERMGVYLKRKHGFDFRCLRFPMVLSPFAPSTAMTAYPSHAFKAAAAGEAFTFPVTPETGMSTLFLDDVTRSIVEIAQADAEKLIQPAYNLHGYYVTAREIAERLRLRYQNFQCGFQPQAAFVNLINGWPKEVSSQGATRDWDWKPGFDFDKTAEAMFRLFEET